MKFAVLVGKQLGKAHERNRHKRWAREAFRKNKAAFHEPGSIIVRFNQLAHDYWQVERTLLEAYQMAVEDRRPGA